METRDEFNVDLFSKSLNDIQGEKGRNERLLQTETSRRTNSEFELQTAIQKRKDAEKRYIDSVKKLATLKNKRTALDRQYEEVMKEHTCYRDEIEAMKDEEDKIESEHKHTLSVHYKILDDIVVKFRSTKLVMMSEIEDGDYSEMERELSLLEGEYGEQENAMDQAKNTNSIYDSNLKRTRTEDCVLKDDHTNVQVLNDYFRGVMKTAEKLIED